MADALSCDDFLGGRLRLWQPRHGYRAGIDPVLLAATIPARPGESVLELGCGAGAALFCLGTRIPDLQLYGVEVQPFYAELCSRNAAENGLTADIVTADLRTLPLALRQRQFHHVFANPPYFDRQHGTAAQDPGRETALGDGIALAEWVKAAARRTAPGGTVTFVQRAERLPELLCAATEHLGSLELLPVQPRRNRPARLILLRGRKGGRASFQCNDGLVLHAGAHHLKDGDDYTDEASAILRNGEFLSFARR